MLEILKLSFIELIGYLINALFLGHSKLPNRKYFCLILERLEIALRIDFIFDWLS